jgi:hypothetical protein
MVKHIYVAQQWSTQYVSQHSMCTNVEYALWTLWTSELAGVTWMGDAKLLFNDHYCKYTTPRREIARTPLSLRDRHTL